MDVIHFPDDQRPARWVQPVLALGNFDGLHRGHRKILDRVRRVAGERGAPSLVMTFDPHPPRIVRPDKAPPLLMTKIQKLDAFAEAGLQGAAIVRFTPQLSHWDPETFVRHVLVDWLRVAEVWVGANFLFGRDRTGNFSLLRALGGRYGFKAEKIDPVRYKDFVVSSTRIRRLIAEGRVDEAGALLGHQYYKDDRVKTLLRDLTTSVLTHLGYDRSAIADIEDQVRASMSGPRAAGEYSVRFQAHGGEIDIDVSSGGSPLFHASRRLP